MADPPDNIGLGYDAYKDKLPDERYIKLLREWLATFIYRAKTVWFSFNAKWTFALGGIVDDLVRSTSGLEAKPCVQTFTFGQHCHHDLGNNHRPLWRLRWADSPLLPDAIRVPSWRQENGDTRADPRGRVPGDVFDFTRVVGNSKQRRSWHPTQLNEGLVERCVKFTTPPGESVLDPFGGTGTTLRVCKTSRPPMHVD
jgi:site-specific DNA-methyltransferase (adenine-specific)